MRKNCIYSPIRHFAAGSFAGLALILAISCPAPAADDDVKTETVLEGLNNPCGVAIQPGTGDVFVSDSAAKRVIRVVDGKAQDVIVGFPQDIYGKGPEYPIGPLGLAFIDKDTLVVGGGGLPDGEEKLRIYKIPQKGAEAIQADKMISSFMLPPTDEIKGEGNFYQLAIAKDAIYATSNGDDTKGWVVRCTINGTKYGPFERWLATKEAVQVDAPVGIAISPDDWLVVGQMGEINIPNDSLLTFYDRKTGKMELNLETDLFDIAALAYSTKMVNDKRQLYALDFAWMDTKEGGLFQLIKTEGENGQGVKAKKIASLDKPTAMAFAEDGTLYIAVIGTAKEGEEKKPGKLLKVAPGL